jgi:hypothetical protein
METVFFSGVTTQKDHIVKLVPVHMHHFIMVYGGVDVKLHEFLASTLDGRE